MVSSCHNCGPPSSCTWGQKWGRSVVPFTKIYSFPSIILPPQQKLIATIAFSFPISTKTSQNINFRFFSKFSTPPTNPEKIHQFPWLHGSASNPGFHHLLGCHLCRAQRLEGTAAEPKLTVAVPGEVLQGSDDLWRSARGTPMGNPWSKWRFEPENMGKSMGKTSIHGGPSITDEGQKP